MNRTLILKFPKTPSRRLKTKELSKTRFSENHQENNHRQPSGIRIEIKQIPAERRRRGVLEICMEKLANFLKVFQRKPTPTRIMPLGNKNFRTMTSVLKFIRIMKENAKIHKKFKKLNSQHYSIINDNASLLPLQSKFFDKKVNKNHSFEIKHFLANKFHLFLENLYDLMTLIDHKLPVIEPDQHFRFFFDIFMLFYIILLACSLFLKYGFMLTENQYYQPLWIIFQQMPLWIFLFEIILELNTSYYSKGIYITNRVKIMKHYFKYNFLLDIITLFPILLFGNFQDQPFDLLLILRLINMSNLMKRLEEYLQLKGKKEGIFQLVKLIINLLFLAHICACFWHFIALYETSMGVPNNWLKVKDIDHEQWYIQYIYSLYFAIVTMMTVGYGDISSYNYIECCFNIFIIIYGCGVFAYTINNIGLIFKEMYQEDKEFKKKIKIINDYMNKRGINKFLQIKIKKYLEYMFEESRANYKDSLLLTQSLSQSLKEECFLELYGKLLKNNKLFGQFSENCLNKLTHHVNEAKFAPDDLIHTQEENEILIYFLIKGEINVLFDENDTLKNHPNYSKLANLKKGESFGELSFLKGEASHTIAKSISVTHVAYLRRSDFLDVLQQFPDDYEKFCYIKDNLHLYNNMQTLQVRCFSCSSPHHLLRSCPLIHYVPDKVSIMKKYLTPISQHRQANIKRIPFKYKATINLSRTQLAVSNFNKVNNMLEDSQESYDSPELDLSPSFELANLDVSNNRKTDETPTNNYKRIKSIAAAEKKENVYAKRGSIMKHKDTKEKDEENEVIHNIKHVLINERTKEMEEIKLPNNEGKTSKKIENYQSLRINTMNEKSLNNISGTPKHYENQKTSPIKDNFLVSPQIRTHLYNNNINTMSDSRFSHQKKGGNNKKNDFSEEYHSPIITSNQTVADNRDNPFDQVILKESVENFDKMKIFKFYFLQNNFDQVMKKYKRKRFPVRKAVFTSASGALTGHIKRLPKKSVF